jgi:hypothetical protein
LNDRAIAMRRRLQRRKMFARIGRMTHHLCALAGIAFIVAIVLGLFA